MGILFLTLVTEEHHSNIFKIVPPFVRTFPYALKNNNILDSSLNHWRVSALEY